MTLPACINQKALAEAFGTQPIATAYLGFEAKFRLPAPSSRLPDQPLMTAESGQPIGLIAASRA